jgi:hypothetical protein
LSQVQLADGPEHAERVARQENEVLGVWPVLRRTPRRHQHLHRCCPGHPAGLAQLLYRRSSHHDVFRLPDLKVLTLSGLGLWGGVAREHAVAALACNNLSENCSGMRGLANLHGVRDCVGIVGCFSFLA